jgi:hypothetical protein
MRVAGIEGDLLGAKGTYCTKPRAEVGKVTWKSNGDEALSDESLKKRNSDEALDDDFP